MPFPSQESHSPTPNNAFNGRKNPFLDLKQPIKWPKECPLMAQRMESRARKQHGNPSERAKCDPPYPKLAVRGSHILRHRKQAGAPDGDAGDPYTGYDRFGRTVDIRWTKTGTNAELDRSQYGFDRDSRRTWQKRPLTITEDLHYQYDGLSQVTNSARGALNINTTAIAGRPVNEEAFDYDPTGNWQGYNAKANGVTTLDQNRVHDRGNRLTQIVDNPNAMILDRAGRMRQMSPNAAGDWSGKLELTWDAWSRITSVTSDGVLVGSYTYDALT